MYLEIYLFILEIPINLNTGFQILPNDPVYFTGICCDIPVIISNFINLDLFLPPPTQIG
jgi:hypothetical protein